MAAASSHDAPEEDFEFRRGGAGRSQEEIDESANDFMDMLLDLKLTGATVSAKHVCLLCHYAVQGGWAHPSVAQFALGPQPEGREEQTGRWHKKLDSVLGIRGDFEYYPLPMPGQDKHELDRTSKIIPTLLPFKTLSSEIASSTVAADRLDAGFVADEWAPSYTSHPVYVGRRVGEQVWPLALYLDGISFQKRDFMWVYVVYNLATGVRHLCVVLRASSLCRCGCGGWCNHSIVLRWLHWNFKALAAGRAPAARHDGSPWGDFGVTPGEILIKGAVVQIKADWAEIVNTLGFMGWGSLLHPCFCCHATQTDLGEMGDFSVSDEPFPAITQAEYEAAVSRCEIVFVVNHEITRARLKGLLDDDVTARGAHGRALRLDFEDRLRKGDRLEPGADLWDTADFDTKPLPFTCIFWRPDNESLAKHRCPLMDEAIGITVETLMIDVLHTLYLHGVYARFCAVLFYALLRGDAWRVGGVDREEVLLKRGITRLRADLFTWYNAVSGRKDIYKLQDLTLGMLGKRGAPEMTTHGAETGTLMEFAVFLANEKRAFLPAATREAWLLASRSLLRYHEIMRTGPQKFTDGQHSEFVNAFRRYIVYSKLAGVPPTPKLHLAMHSTHRAGRNGNPKYYGVFLDEHLNGRMADIGQGAHRSTFYMRILSQFNTFYAGLDGARVKRTRR